MFCPTCGTSNAASSRCCSACGLPLPTANATAIATGVLTPPEGDLTPGRRTGATPQPPAADSSGVLETAAARTWFGDRYHIIRPIGVGGMGAVYQAWDTKLAVAVALKVIRRRDDQKAEVIEELERRFKRELLLARQVTHKNVVRIHDLGEVDGTLYITMPYIQGENLASIVAREGKLSVRRTLQIAKQVASGLVAAHEAGVIHRDLKPANIMIEAESDRALIMDFGIARSTDAATQTASIVGTLEYMAPEQAAGLEVDQRCDIYAFGLILYDLLTGGRPPGSSVADLLARLQKPLPPLRSLVPDIPEAFERVINRCIERDTWARYESSQELVAALDALTDAGELRPATATPRIGGRAIVAAAVLMLAAVITFVATRGRRETTAPPQHEPVSVLIADFENRANDPVFDESLEQALTIGMEGASFVTTMPRKDAHRLAAQIGGGKLDEAAASLISLREGVKFVVAGSIEADGPGYRINARLIDPAVRKTIKTATTRAKSKGDVLQAVGAIAADVRRDLGDATSETARLAASETFTTSSLDAVKEYVIAQELAQNSKFTEAIPHYKRAIDADPQFGRAFAGWAVSAFELGRNDEAAEQWKKALALMDRMTDRERFRTLGTYYLRVARNPDQAIDSYQKVIEAYPSDRMAHNNLAVAYFSKLNFTKALEEGRKTIEIYKGNPKYRNNYALYAMYASDFDTAEKGARELVTEDSKFADAYIPLAISLLAKGDRPGARKAYEQMLQSGGDGPSRASLGLADLAMYEGRFADAEAILARSLVQDAEDKNDAGVASKSVALAETYVALGNTARALDAARKALAASRQESVAVPMSRVLVTSGRLADVRALATDLDKDLQPQPRAYAKIIEGELALQQDRPAEAVEAFRAASRLMDVWLSHFDLGVAYVRAGHYAEAIAEFDTCTKRRGEATSMFLDDLPTFRYLATLPYWLARAQEGVGMKNAAADNYKAFLALRPDPNTKDPLAADARKRSGS